VVSLSEQGEKQIPFIISQATRQRVAQYSLVTIQNLHESIPRRIQAVLQANGDPTPY